MSKKSPNLKKMIRLLAGVWVSGTGLLTACSAVQGDGNPINITFLVLAILMLLVLATGLMLLIRSGKFKQWSSAGINVNKWKNQERKLRAQKEKAEQDKADLILALGEKAWKAKVSHPDYAEHFNALSALDERRTRLVDEVDVLEAELKKANTSKEKVAAEYSQQISDLESLHKDAAKKIEKTTSRQEKLQKEYEKLNKDQEKVLAEIEEQQQKLTEAAASDNPDKDQRIAAIDESIQSLRASTDSAAARMAEIESELSRLEIEQQPYQDKTSRFTSQIATVEEDQQATLAPLEGRIAELEDKIAAKKAEIEVLEQQIKPMIESLGPLVDQARPVSEALKATYKKIDDIKAELGEISQEVHLIVARLATCDQGAVRNFYLMLAGILLLVVLSVVFFFLAFG